MKNIIKTVLFAAITATGLTGAHAQVYSSASCFPQYNVAGHEQIQITAIDDYFLEMRNKLILLINEPAVTVEIKTLGTEVMNELKEHKAMHFNMHTPCSKAHAINFLNKAIQLDEKAVKLLKLLSPLASKIKNGYTVSYLLESTEESLIINKTTLAELQASRDL